MKKIVFITIISLIGIVTITLGGVAIAQNQHIFPEPTNNILANYENTSDTEQKNKETTEPVLTNSDNASDEELSPEDELIARLAQRTYLSAEEFGIIALTEQEKADCIAIASQHPAVSGFVGRSSEYITVFRWIGLSPSGGYGLLHYDVVEKGIPSVLGWPKRATFFPAVGFRTATYSYVLAIDLDTREVVYVTSGPIRKGPN